MKFTEHNVHFHCLFLLCFCESSKKEIKMSSKWAEKAHNLAEATMGLGIAGTGIGFVGHCCFDIISDLSQKPKFKLVTDTIARGHSVAAVGSLCLFFGSLATIAVAKTVMNMSVTKTDDEFD